jgi:hypothetical protein
MYEASHSALMKAVWIAARLRPSLSTLECGWFVDLP